MIKQINGLALGAYRRARRVVIFVIGATVLIFGCVMMVTPGPGVAAIIIGLGILAIEFEWARRWLRKAKAKAKGAAAYVQNGLGLQAKEESPHNASATHRHPASTGHAPE